MANRVVFVILGILFAIGLGLGAVGYGLGRLDRTREQHFATANGTVTALEHVRESPEGAPETTADVPVLHFATPDGRNWDVRAAERVPAHRFLEGDHVHVRYELANPAMAYIDGTRPPVMTWFAWLFGALFCLASAGAAWAVFADRDRDRKPSASAPVS